MHTRNGQISLYNFYDVNSEQLCFCRKMTGARRNIYHLSFCHTQYIIYIFLCDTQNIYYFNICYVNLSLQWEYLHSCICVGDVGVSPCSGTNSNLYEIWERKRKWNLLTLNRLGKYFFSSSVHNKWWYLPHYASC